MRVYDAAGVALMLFLLGACSGAARKETLRDAIDDYHHGIRWGEVNHAASFLRGPFREAFLSHHERLADLKITNVTVLRVHTVDSHTAVVSARIDWYRLTRGQLHATTVQQRWKRDGDRWSIESQYRVGGAPLPLFRKAGPSTMSRGRGG